MNYKRLYIPDSLVFITVVTKDRKPILVDNIGYLRDSFRYAKSRFAFDVIAIIINEDHFHMIIKPEDINVYPKIVGLIKSTFTKVSKLDHTSNNRRESDIWQRRYWEHTIVDEEDLNRHIDYIHYNSMKHYGIAPKLWEYSTFKKFVENGYYDMNWCNFGDKYNIDKLSYE